MLIWKCADLQMWQWTNRGNSYRDREIGVGIIGNCPDSYREVISNFSL